MSILTVSIPPHKRHTYKIFIQENGLPELLRGQYGKYAIITDTTVKKLHGERLKKQLSAAGMQSEIYTVPPGERSKRLAMVELLAEQMITKGFDRNDVVLALGGGVIGDLAGLLAALYMRGIPCIHIPTTLLAMVDSCCGGKTGVDLQSGKNLLGTFTHPHAILINTSLLASLPKSEIQNGLAEVIKYGVIASEKLFKFIEQNLEKIYACDQKTINYIITASLRIKRDIVQSDEKEKNTRMLLNYGHTIGHALEMRSNYTLSHGHAISIGMHLVNQIGIQKGTLSPTVAERIKNLLEKTDLPTKAPYRLTHKDLAKDKKRQGDKIHLIIPTKIGHAIITKEPLASLQLP